MDPGVRRKKFEMCCHVALSQVGWRGRIVVERTA
jgi:hypothetical protein